MSQSTFYDGTKLLSLMDINGNKPEIYMVESNRNDGKTTFFNRYAFNRFKKKKEKFIILVRFGYELNNIEDRYFKDIRELFFPYYTMTSKGIVDGKFRELFVSPNDQEELTESCGYAMALNDADLIKRYSHFFSDAELVLFDEFQSENNHYCADEIKKFKSVHKSLARGRGKQVRYLPVIMMSNAVTLLNPYYTAFGLGKKINNQTKFIKSKGLVFERHFNEFASKAGKESGFMQAFDEDDEYSRYANDNEYLNDNNNFVEKLNGKNKYICTFKYKNREYAIRTYDELGIVYCDDRPDSSCKSKICVTTSDHNVNYVMLKNNEMFLANLRFFFNKGCFRFKDLDCKEAVLAMLSY